MALNIAQRPQGVVLSTTPLSATITTNSGDALVTYNSHGLTTGDTVFITSDYSYYNGFWQALVINPNTFEIRNHTYADSVLFVVNANVTFYKVQTTHYFSSVHLPIIYKLQNTLWPTNSVDTARTMTVTNTAGYCTITASGDIKATGSAQELEYVKIVTLSGTYDGIYKIIDYSSDTIFTIDLEYSSATETELELGTSTVQYYYSNYHAKIRIYGGITGTGSVIKPVELITEVEAVPDSDGIITLNINEHLKSKVEIVLNDPALVTMPRDINAFCEFYISYAESYDQTLGGYTLGTYTSSYTSDSGTPGYAINSKLPFKNRYAGFMSEYLGNSRKFMTMFSSPVLFVGDYFDITFLQNSNEYIILKRERYLNGSLVGNSYDIISDYGQGVYRKQISQELTEDRIDVSLVTVTTETYTNGRATDLSNGFDSVTLGHAESTGATSFDFYHRAYSGFIGEDIVIAVNVQSSDLSGDVLLNLIIYNSDKSLNANITPIPITYNGSYVMEITSSTFATAWVEIALDNGGAGPVDWEIDVLNSDASETKTIEVNSDCSNQDIYITWKNPLGGHDYWKFTAEKEYGVDILDVKESENNLITNWPKSYGEFADTVKYDISRTANDTILVRSQNLTLDQVQAMKYIKTSPLVQIMTSKTDRRTVRVDRSSFTTYNETDKLYGIQFTISYTNDIESQTL